MNMKIQALWEAFPGCAVVLSAGGAMLVDGTGKKLVEATRPTEPMPKDQKIPEGFAIPYRWIDFRSPDEALDALRADVNRMLEERSRLDGQRVILGRSK